MSGDVKTIICNSYSSGVGHEVGSPAFYEAQYKYRQRLKAHEGFCKLMLAVFGVKVTPEYVELMQPSLDKVLN